jgi:hypothetical protein
MSKNDITGDSIRSKPLSKEAEDNWDRIFKKQGITLTEEELADVEIIADIVQHHHNKKEKFNRRNIKPEIFTIPKEKHIHTMLPEYHLHPSTGEVEKRFKDGVSKPNGEQFNDE